MPLIKKYQEFTSYSPMGKYCTDYEAYSAISDSWNHYGLHCHDFFEFYIFFRGISYFCIDEQVIPLKPYTLVILPPFYLHGLVGHQVSNSYERSWLYVTPAMMQTIGMGIQNLSAFFTECVQTGKAYYYLDRDTAGECRTIIEKITNGMETKSQIEKWNNYIHVAELLSKIYHITHAFESIAKPVILNETIQSILTYINNHFTESISIPELSRRFNISSSYMARTFAAYTGRSLYDYVLYRRIMLAKEIINDGKTLTEAAYECGFNDYSGFLRAFINTTGQSPSTYRKHINSLY